MNTASFVISVLSFAMAAVALFVSLRRERKRLSVRGRHYVIAPDPGMPYQERHIEVIAVNRRHRPITVMELGMYVQGEDGEFKRIDGKTRPKLPATLGDGDIALMSWAMDEWGEPGEFDAKRITRVFARDDSGNTIEGQMNRDPDASWSW